jgi:hypothetical protein
MTKYLSLIIFSIFCASTSLATEALHQEETEKRYAVIHIHYYTDDGSLWALESIPQKIKRAKKKAGHSALAIIEVPLPFSNDLMELALKTQELTKLESDKLNKELADKWVKVRDEGRITYVSFPYGFSSRLLIQSDDERDYLKQRIDHAKTNSRDEDGTKSLLADIDKFRNFDIQHIGLIDENQLRAVESFASRSGIADRTIVSGIIRKYFVRDLQTRAKREANAKAILTRLRAERFKGSKDAIEEMDPAFEKTSQFVFDTPQSFDWNIIFKNETTTKEFLDLKTLIKTNLGSEFPILSDEEHRKLNEFSWRSNNCSAKISECLSSIFFIPTNLFFYAGFLGTLSGGGFTQTPGHLSQKILDLSEKGLLNASIPITGNRASFLKDLTQVVYAAQTDNNSHAAVSIDQPNLAWSILSILSAFPNEMGGVDDDE